MSIEAKVNLRELLSKINEVSRDFEIRCNRGEPGCNETEFMVRVEDIFNKVWQDLGVPKPVHEYKVYVTEGFVARYYGRIDAWYGLAFFEYKLPYPGLKDNKIREDAIDKCRSKYVPGLLNDMRVREIIEDIRGKGYKPLITGIIFDGLRVIFITYDVDLKRFDVDPPFGYYEINESILRKIILRVAASYRKGLVASELSSRFGYGSSIAKKFVKTLYHKLVNPRSERTRSLFDEWYKLVSQAYPINAPEIAEIASEYGFGKDEEVDGAKLFYAIQTYYALILKLIAAEIAGLYHDSAARSFLEVMRRTEDPERLCELLSNLEEGGMYSAYGIRNYLEGEFFSWYLDEWDRDIYSCVKEVIDALSEYSFESILEDVRRARDLFKLLYEELIPRKEVRQKLGIYATPDWLAELVLNELDLTVDKFKDMKEKDPIDIRVLDPGAGTATFLVLYIQRLGRYLREYYGPKLNVEIAREALRKITRNAVGFDIDVLAVLTARTNYLITLAAIGLLDKKGDESIEIPIYIANSVVTAEEMRDKIITKKGEVIEAFRIETTKEKFLIPSSLVRDGRILNILSDLRPYIKERIPFKSIANELNQRYNLSEIELSSIEEMYKKLLNLEVAGIDRLWIPIIKSYIVPVAYKGRFDYIIGNPPWLSYRYIADPGYQAIIKSLIKDVYGLVVDENLMTHMEMATLFFVRCMDLYLRDGGLIGFVMPRSIFSSDQHHMFRMGISNIEYRITKIIDCENVKPLFYVPTCAIIAEKEGKTTWPVDAVVVEGELPEDRHKVISLDEAKSYLKIDRNRKLYLVEVGSRSYLGYERPKLPHKKSYYYTLFYQGATIVPQAAWLIDVIDSSHPNVVTAKTSRRIEARGKVREEIGPIPIEREFIYGVLTSAEVFPFCYLQPNPAVLPIKPSGEVYVIIRRDDARRLGKIHLAEWLEEAEKLWSRVRGEKKVDLYEWLNYQNKLAKQNPSAKYKVVYLRSGTHLCACIVENKPMEINNVKLNGIIIDATLYWFETNDYNEACYLAAIFNSKFIDEEVKPLQSKGEFGPRDFHKKPLEFPIPRYNPSDPIHRRLAELGRSATEKANKILPELLNALGYDRRLKERGCLMPQEVARLREEIRNHLKDIINEIDGLVMRLLTSASSSTKGSLLEFINKH